MIDYELRYKTLRDLLVASAELSIVDPLAHRWRMSILMVPETFEPLTTEIFDREYSEWLERSAKSNVVALQGKK